MELHLRTRWALGGAVYHYEVEHKCVIVAHSDEIAHWADPGLVQLDAMRIEIEAWMAANADMEIPDEEEQVS